MLDTYHYDMVAVYTGGGGEEDLQICDLQYYINININMHYRNINIPIYILTSVSMFSIKC
jgi:hypothetical protein